MTRVIKDEYPTARKEHQCYFCGGVIPKGEKYHRSIQTDGHSIDTFATHLDCYKVAQELRMWDDCDEGLSSDDFFYCLSDYIYENFRKDEAVELRQRKIYDIVQIVLADIEKEKKK